MFFLFLEFLKLQNFLDIWIFGNIISSNGAEKFQDSQKSKIIFNQQERVSTFVSKISESKIVKINFKKIKKCIKL